MKRALGLVALAGLALTACVQNNADEDAETIAVTSTADGCQVATNTAQSGTLAFEVKNDGNQVTEFYMLGDDKLRIIGEVENIAPGTSRTLTFVAQPGSYFTVCKPGMVGDGIGEAGFTVTGEAVEVAVDDEEAFAAAVTNYTAYTKTQVAELVTNVTEFTNAYKAGDDELAKKLFPITRINYERIEPTAEQFGDLDPKIDYRKPGADAEGLEWTGFHRIEADLWLDEAKKNYPGDPITTALTPEQRTTLADQLVADVKTLYEQVHSDSFKLGIEDITNGAIGLLDEVAAPDGKLPGEEDEFSHTDLYDFYANVEGAEVAYLNVRDIAAGKDGGDELVTTLNKEFGAMKSLLGKYGDYDSGFVSYDTVGQEERNALGAQLNALSEPLSKLTSQVLGVS
ncbi:peptidase M75 family protein [Frankia sp. CNm7]|uniref:Peptidase M75 family protein n=1 Tax=Frankia nepalensis TaxID=1836974 RepID=A0A937UQC9_9ACTN|nr:iron uptake system protein EfeO [Frankia nepalensis]MBL7495623.1 peptidase M75 family protein [Frankia nepalensis]MBL7508869.1 peptidase M75 family protein [Frankia nepalensis]MBL7520317.1 peptidase M75 family protein [Frankia nepalensis]MBL7630092.1 peptidase M75 family protein [Frankia nepalensis]